VRLIAFGLLSGLTVDEIAALNWDDVDFAAGTIRIGGADARTMPLEGPMRALLAARQQRQGEADGRILQTAAGDGIADAEAARLVLFAAYEAGLDRPQEVTPLALRYTFISYLLRQGIRAADIDSIIGQEPHNELVAWMQAELARHPAADRRHRACFSRVARDCRRRNRLIRC
jgi:polysaccharide biosynthesis transport protein